jgi:5'-phosphate synthase pdxT subunit
MAGGIRQSAAVGSGGEPEGQPQAPHIGVLALQGAFREHVRLMRKLGAKVTEVRLPRDLDGLDGLMIPGGESTTIGLLLDEYKLMEPLRDFVKDHPVFGTCAGLIMLAKHTTDGEQPLLQVMDITVRRNAFGRQTRSFEASVALTQDPAPGTAPAEFHGIFIRAPWVEEVGPGVEVIARYGDHIVGVRQGDMMGVAFHPELGDDARLHEYFLQMVRASLA